MIRIAALIAALMPLETFGRVAAHALRPRRKRRA